MILNSSTGNSRNSQGQCFVVGLAWPWRPGNLWMWWVAGYMTEKTVLISLMIQMYPILTTAPVFKNILLQSCGFYGRLNHKNIYIFWTCILLEWKYTYILWDIGLAASKTFTTYKSERQNEGQVAHRLYQSPQRHIALLIFLFIPVGRGVCSWKKGGEVYKIYNAMTDQDQEC